MQKTQATWVTMTVAMKRLNLTEYKLRQLIKDNQLEVRKSNRDTRVRLVSLDALREVLAQEKR